MFAELLRGRAAEHPDAVALAVHGGACLTFGQWERRSDVVGGALRRRGVSPGVRVVLVFDRWQWGDAAVAYAAVQRVGGVAVTLWPGWQAPAPAEVVADCGAVLVVGPEHLLPRASGVRSTQSVALADLEREGHEGASDVAAGPDHLADLVYSAGPLRRARSVSRSCEDIISGLDRIHGGRALHGTWVHTYPIGTGTGAEALWFTLAAGGRQLGIVGGLEGDTLCALVERERAVCVGVTPLSATMLVESAAVGRHDLSSVEQVVVAEGRSRRAVLAGLATAFPSAALVDAGTLPTTAGRRTLLIYDRRRPGAQGRVEPAGEVVVVDDDGRPQPDGEVGHVKVRLEGEPGWVGPGAGGQANAQAPPGSGAGLGYLDEGLLYPVTSRGDVIRVAGVTVSSAEVREVLCQHQGVADAAVLGLPHDAEADRLVAAVVAASSVGADELRADVRRRLGDLRTPGEILFVDGIPRNPSGVVLLRRLRRELNLPVPPGVPEHAGSEVHETVAAVWRRVLGRHDVEGHDFFELGGDPLAATRVKTLIEDALGVAVPLSTLLESTTVGSLASAVARLQTAPQEPTQEPAPVAFSQEGMLWHEQFAPGCQNLPALARRFRGPLHVGALERALAEIVRRHEPLRSTFELRDGRPVQVIAPPVAGALPVRDLSPLAAEEKEARLEEAVGEASRPLDLVGGPLFQATLYRLDADDHVLVLRTHHSVYDDWSVAVFRRELSALYDAFVVGQPSPLEELPVSFGEFARAQRRRLAGREGARQLAYWTHRLEGGPLALQLPIGDPQRPSGAPQPSTAPVRVELAGELPAALRALARNQRATMFMTVLAAFQVLVHRWTGQSDLLLSSVVANRNRRHLEGLIGCFSKKILLRLTAAGDPTFSEVLARARTVLLEALANQDLPFEAVLQEALGAAAADHGLVPHPVVMFQGVTPPPGEVVLTGLTSSGLATTASSARRHFMAGDSAGAAPEAHPWGAGLYSGTFLILSLVEAGKGLALVARGAFHRPAVEELLTSFRALLDDVVAHPERRVSEFAVATPAVEEPAGGDRLVEFRGFRVELARIEAALASCPGVQDVAVVVQSVTHDPLLAAYVVPDGNPPTLTALQVHLWRQLPGYAWPAAMVILSALPRDRRGGLDRATLPQPGGWPRGHGPAQERVLAGAWAEALGVEEVVPAGNYWQSFSFLDAVSELVRTGCPAPSIRVARERTVRTLAADLAAGPAESG